MAGSELRRLREVPDEPIQLSDLVLHHFQVAEHQLVVAPDRSQWIAQFVAHEGDQVVLGAQRPPLLGDLPEDSHPIPAPINEARAHYENPGRFSSDELLAGRIAAIRPAI